MKRILYTAIGSIFGLTCGITWDLLFSSRTVVVSTWPAELNAPLVLWGLAGMVIGGRAVDPLAIEQGDNRDSGPFYPLQIETQPARCAWCQGQGRRLIFFLCPVCGGQGHMLVVLPGVMGPAGDFWGAAGPVVAQGGCNRTLLMVEGG